MKVPEPVDTDERPMRHREGEQEKVSHYQEDDGEGEDTVSLNHPILQAPCAHIYQRRVQADEDSSSSSSASSSLSRGETVTGESDVDTDRQTLVADPVVLPAPATSSPTGFVHPIPEALDVARTGAQFTDDPRLLAHCKDDPTASAPFQVSTRLTSGQP